MPEKRKPAIAAALKYLGSLKGEDAHASIRRLAHDAGVSYMTMWKACHSKDGKTAFLPASVPVQSAGQRSGKKPARGAPIIPGNHIPSSCEDAGSDIIEPPGLTWQRIKRKIEMDFILGGFGRKDPLPSAKELCVRYNASFKTLRKALDRLRFELALHKKGRRYFPYVKNTSFQSGLRTALLLYNFSRERALNIFSDYDKDFVNELERESAERGVMLELILFWFENGEPVFIGAGDSRKPGPDPPRNIDGFIMPVFHKSMLHDAIFERLRSQRKPVTIIDEIGGWIRPTDFPRNRLLIINARPFRLAAEEMGLFIAAKRHRRIGFFSPFHSDHWSHACLQGLSTAFQSAGDQRSIRIWTEKFSQIDHDLDLVNPVRERQTGKQAAAFYAEWKAQLPDSYVGQFDFFFTTLLSEQIGHAEGRLAMARHFEAPSRDGDISCWVAACGDAVWYAHDFIRSHNLNVGLVGFGNSTEITNRRITTYSFNPGGAANAAIEHLLHPGKKLPGQTGNECTIKGRIIDRGSI